MLFKKIKICWCVELGAFFFIIISVVSNYLVIWENKTVRDRCFSKLTSQRLHSLLNSYIKDLCA